MLEATEVSVVQNNGFTYLCKLDGQQAVLAYCIGDRTEEGGRDLSQAIGKMTLKYFIGAQLIPGKLGQINFSDNADLGFRRLTIEEIANYDSLIVMAERAKEIAIPKLIEKEFQSLGK